MKVTFNALKKNRAGRYIWRDSGRWANISAITRFKKLRSKAARKRERRKKAFIETFKRHVTISKNIHWITYCRNYTIIPASGSRWNISSKSSPSSAGISAYSSRSTNLSQNTLLHKGQLLKGRDDLTERPKHDQQI